MVAKRVSVMAPILFVILALVASACGGDKNSGPPKIVINDNDGADYNPVINPADFVAEIDHPMMYFEVGRSWEYEGEEDGEPVRILVEVTDESKSVLGIPVTVVRDRVWEDGELVEDTRDWFAQDIDGNVWYFGEAVDDYEGGVIVGHGGEWEAGVDGAKPGILMPAAPTVGDAYRQEFYEGEAEDMAQVLRTDESINIGGGGTFHNCLRTKEWSPLEPDVVEEKVYCEGVGSVVLEEAVEGETARIVVTSYMTL